MSIDVTEKRFEQDIETFMLSIEGGYTKTTDTYDANCGLYVDTLIKFIQNTQLKCKYWNSIYYKHHIN